MIMTRNLQARAMDRHQRGNKGNFHAVIMQFASARLNQSAVIEQEYGFSFDILSVVGEQI